METVQESLVKAIIKEQSQIIGASLARSLAESSGVLSFFPASIGGFELKPGQSKEAVETLVNAYAKVFGQASINACMDVISKFPQNEVVGFIPESLKKQN